MVFPHPEYFGLKRHYCIRVQAGSTETSEQGEAIMEQACEAEVRELHEFLVEWMTGVLPRTPEAYERFAKVIADDFVIINPGGALTERTSLIDDLEAAYGVHAEPPNPDRGNIGEPKDFRIWIENCRCRHQEGGLSLVTYEEWQQMSGAVTGRLSTALFRSCGGTPNGVEWLHLHETWLPLNKLAS
jgi:hypothetical protein